MIRSASVVSVVLYASAVAAAETPTESSLSWHPNGGAAHAHGVAAVVAGPLVGYGVGLDAMGVWSPLLLSAGGGFTWCTVDRPEPKRVSTEPAGALPPIDVDVEDRRLALHIAVRLTAPKSWALRPYAEGLASAIRWSSVYTLRFQAGGDNAEVATAIDWSMGLAWGFGLLVPSGSPAGMHFALGFRRHSEGRREVQQDLDTLSVVDAFPRHVNTVLVGAVAEF